MVDFIESAKKLIQNGKGEPDRLKHIINTLEQGKKLYSSDLQYLEDLIEKYITKESKNLQSNSKSVTEGFQSQTDAEKKSNQATDPREVEELRHKVKELEEKFGKREHFDSWKQENYKSLGVTVLLSFGVGLILLGIGHFYVGKGGRGFAWLIGGLAVYISFGFMASLSGFVSSNWGATVFFGIIYFILLIVSTLSAASYCKEWNRNISEGITPW